MVSVTLMPASPFHSKNDANLKSLSQQQVSSSKLILQSALRKAQQAVEFDHVNDFPHALQSYQDALSLITEVLDSSPSFRSNPRLINIVSFQTPSLIPKQTSYLERVTLLTSLIDTASDIPFVNHDSSPRLSRARSEVCRGVLKPEEKVDRELTEGHDILSSALDAINKWPQDIPSPQQYASPPTTRPNSFLLESQHLSKQNSAASTPERFSLLLDYDEPLLGDSRINDRPGSLQLPQFTLAESQTIPQSRLTRWSSDSVLPSSSSGEYSEPTSPKKLLEAEFPEGVASILTRRGKRSSHPTPCWAITNRAARCCLRSTVSNWTSGDFSLDTKKIPHQPTVGLAGTGSPSPELGRAQNSNRRISSLPSTTRPSSFLLAATKVVELAVKDSAPAHPPRYSGRQYNPINIQRVFREEPSEVTSLLIRPLTPSKDCVFETPPISSDLKVFWLMRSLERSMTSGGYVSRKLYIPKSVWFQSGVRLQAIEIKVQSCGLVADYLVRFKGLEVADTANILKELEGLDALLNTVQIGLSKRLPFIEPLRRVPTSAFASLGSRISKSVEKIQMSYLKLKSDANGQYVECLIKLFKSSQFLEKWYQHFVSLNALNAANVQIIARLNRVNSFLYTSIMLAKYLKRLRANITD
ncbi:hypothetical protein L0F63_003138 [Massospora cicadina]|nr:hypothetical protein L0F63_003138 [Massospora cicadina]